MLESFGHGANGKPHALTSAVGMSYLYAEGGGIETVMPGSGGSDGADAGDDSGASLATGSWKDSAVVQGVGGFFAGLAVGVVPGAGPTSDGLIKQKVLAEGTREARIGKALGEMVGGLALSIGGLTGKLAGLVMSGTGVGALAGLPAIALSAVDGGECGSCTVAARGEVSRNRQAWHWVEGRARHGEEPGEASRTVG